MDPASVSRHAVRRGLRHLASAFALVPFALRIGGGLGQTLAKVIRIYRREGLRGIRRGWLMARHAQQVGAGPNDYAEWVRRFDTLSDAARGVLRERAARFAFKPLISVVMPVYNPRPEWLVDAIESVRQQIYGGWELCIADDASTDPAIRPILERYLGEDARIKVVFRERNGHISAASNSALTLASGEWIALLDHDDRLSEHALFWMADAINRHPHARMIYSDEDKIDVSGARSSPYFKCDWNIDLFYSQNMFSHLGAYHAALVRAVGGFRAGLEGSQDYDLALRCTERVDAGAIHHIPRVLYHWRVHAGSAANSPLAKPYARVNGARALNQHFERQGIRAVARHFEFGYQVHYALPDPVPPMVTLIIPTRNGLPLLRRSLGGILAMTDYPRYEIVVVDNGSDDAATLQYLEALRRAGSIRVVRDDRPFNYSALNNLAVAGARGELIALVNNDVEVISPDWLSLMVAHALRPGVGVVGARLLYPDKSVQHAGVILGLRGVAGHCHIHLPHRSPGYFGRALLTQTLSAVTAACMVVKKATYQEVGGMNETDLAVAYGDIDFCLKVRDAGHRNVLAADVELYHHASASRGQDDTPQKRARLEAESAYMKSRWGRALKSDPAYSPNLTLDYADFSLAWPPRIGNLED